MKRGSSPFHILLVEDNPGDVDLIVDVLERLPVPVRFSVFSDGAQTLSFLQDRQPNDVLPDLILLDLNLPKMDGREVLAQLKQSESLKHLPVVVLTSSAAERDLLQAYRLHANCFVTKPADFKEFFAAVKAIGDFWLTVAKLPPRLSET